MFVRPKEKGCGGSNTKRQFLSSLEFSASQSQFLMATFLMDGIDVYSELKAVNLDVGNQIHPFKALYRAARSLNYEKLKIVDVSYNSFKPYKFNHFQVSNL